jgi:hypothetical protein
MRLVQRILAVVVLLLSAVVFAACVAGAIGVWVIRDPLLTRGTRILDRTDSYLREAAEGTGQINTALVRADASLDTVRKAPPPMGKPDFKTRMALRMAADTIRNDVNGRVGGAREQLLNVTEAAVVANSLLGDVNELPLVDRADLDAADLRQASGHLTQVADLSRQLSDMLEKGETKDGKELGDAVNEKTSAVARTLGLATTATQSFEGKLDRAREHVAVVRSRFVTGVNVGTPVACVVLLWLALSQVSLFAHARGWLRGEERAAPAAGGGVKG